MVSFGGVLLSRSREANRNVADEHAARRGVQLNGLSQQLAQDLRRGAQGHIAAAVLQNEIGGKLEVATQNLGFVFAFVELRLDRVTAGRCEAELVLLAIGTSLDIAERLKQIHEADIGQSLHVDERDGVVALRGVDAELLGILSVNDGEVRDRGSKGDCRQDQPEPERQMFIGERKPHPVGPRTM